MNSKSIVWTGRQSVFRSLAYQVVEPNDPRSLAVVPISVVGLGPREPELSARNVCCVDAEGMMTDTTPPAIVEDLDTAFSVRAPRTSQPDRVLIYDRIMYIKYSNNDMW